jgi:hypothetical protein
MAARNGINAEAASRSVLLRIVRRSSRTRRKPRENASDVDAVVVGVVAAEAKPPFRTRM